MKTILKLLVISMLGQGLICPQAMADRRGGGGNANQGRQQQSSGGQRQMPRVQQSAPRQNFQRQAVPRQSIQRPSVQRQQARPAFRQPVNPPQRQMTNRAVPQVPRNYAAPRQATQRNQVVPAPRRTAQQPQVRSAANRTSGNRTNAVKPAVLPRRDVAARNASTRATTLPGNRAATSDRQRNQPPGVRNQADRGRIVGTRPDSRPAVVRPGQNTLPARNPELGRVVGTKPWWSGEQAGVNRNFRQNVNWSTGRRHWGYSPWWNRSYVRPWYGGCWNWGWNRAYYHNHYCYSGWYWGHRLPGYVVYDSYYPVGWGLVGWGLGSLVYDIGYSSYSNPYPVSVPVSSQGLDVSYTEPLARLAAQSAPADDAAVEESTRKSESWVAESQSAFKQRNYLVALEFADKAIAESPGDGALHEYRALVLFALGKYGDAAGVLNPVIASGPGWDWTTMIAIYDSQETYTDQLRKLEAYTKAKPGDAGSYFLLGYHYMVCGQLDLATPQFELAAKLMPADKVSKDLAQLTRFTTKDASESTPVEPAAEAPAVEPVPLEKLTGVWVSNRDSGTITLTFRDDGKFTWLFVKNGKTTELAGDFSINDNGMLVLNSQESQMVASVALPAESEMKFVLAGGPPADPGLEFKKH